MLANLPAPSEATPPLADLIELGKALAASGYFKDATETAQAVTKVLAGRELGIPPIASMTGVYIVEGRITLGANLMAAVIKRHPRYDYRVVKLSDELAEIAFFENGEQVGTSEFTMADARRAGLADKQNFKRYPRNMLMWRALSNGAKFYCPDAFAGAPVYTPDELGAEIDPQTGEVIEASLLPAIPREAVSAAPPQDLPPKPSPRLPEPRGEAKSDAVVSAPAVSVLAAESAAGPPAAQAEGRPDAPPASAPADGDRPITEDELGKLREYLDVLKAPEAFYRMGLLSWGLTELSELTLAQARELAERAKVRFGGES